MTTLFWPLNMVFWFTKFNHLTAEYWIPISLIWLFWQLNIKLPSAYDLTVFDKIYIFRIFANLFPTLIPCFFLSKNIGFSHGNTTHSGLSVKKTKTKVYTSCQTNNNTTCKGSGNWKGNWKLYICTTHSVSANPCASK